MEQKEDRNCQWISWDWGRCSWIPCQHVRVKVGSYCAFHKANVKLLERRRKRLESIQAFFNPGRETWRKGM